MQTGRSEQELVKRSQGGDEDAFLELYLLYRDKIYRFAYRMLGERLGAEAIVFLQRAAELNGEEDAIYYQLAQALRASGRLAEARTAMERVSQLKAKKRAPLLRGS